MKQLFSGIFSIKFAAIVVAALILVGCGAKTPTPTVDNPSGTPNPVEGEPTDPGTDIAAKVNGQPVMMEAFRRELTRWEAGQVALGGSIADESGYQQQVLDMMIDWELIRQYGQSEGVSVSDAEVDAEINQMITESGQEYFDSWLASNYYTLEEFREVIRLQLLTNKVLEPVIATVPDVSEHVHARQILVLSEAQANEALNRLNAGEDFGALAAEYSIDVTTRDNGGDLGWFPRGGLLVPEVEASAFGLEPGQTSGVIASAWGYHIVQTLEYEPARAIDEQMRPRLVTYAMEQWRLQLRQAATIEYLIDLTP